jgi:hypothetical protein
MLLNKEIPFTAPKVKVPTTGPFAPGSTAAYSFFGSNFFCAYITEDDLNEIEHTLEHNNVASKGTM